MKASCLCGCGRCGRREEAKARHAMAVLRRGLTEPWEKSGVLEREPSQEVVLAAIRAAEEAGDQGPQGLGGMLDQMPSRGFGGFWGVLRSLNRNTPLRLLPS